MELRILRRYYPCGTNGQLYVEGKLFCNTIELPWKDNQTGISCIPEGRYKVEKRTSQHHGNHVILKGVAGRDLILIHKANNAMQELRGCIAPVAELTGPGLGSASKAMFDPLMKTIYQAFASGAEVFITLIKNPL